MECDGWNVMEWSDGGRGSAGGRCGERNGSVLGRCFGERESVGGRCGEGRPVPAKRV